MSGDGKAPTMAESWWMEQCRELPCVCCRRLGRFRPMQEYHHILEGGRRVGHACGLPLCNECHQIAGGPASFERRFKFTEMDLLNDVIELVVGLLRMRGRA